MTDFPCCDPANPVPLDPRVEAARTTLTSKDGAPSDADIRWLLVEIDAVDPVRAALGAARAEIERLEESRGIERLVHAIQEQKLREATDKAPRWDEDRIVIENGWLDGRCGRCGEALPDAAALGAARARTDAQIEAGAKCAYEIYFDADRYSWGSVSEHIREHWRRIARAAVLGGEPE